MTSDPSLTIKPWRISRWTIFRLEGIDTPPAARQTRRESAHVEAPRVDCDKLSGSRLSEPSAAIRARVEKARKLQHARFHDSKLACNADMGPAKVRQFCELDEVSRSLLRSVGTRPPAVPKVPAPLGAGTTVQRTMPSAESAEGEVPLPAARQMQLSARTGHRLLKVGRTIAVLAGSERIQTAHLAKAIQYRRRKL